MGSTISCSARHASATRACEAPLASQKEALSFGICGLVGCGTARRVTFSLLLRGRWAGDARGGDANGCENDEVLHLHTRHDSSYGQHSATDFIHCGLWQ